MKDTTVVYLERKIQELSDKIVAHNTRIRNYHLSLDESHAAIKKYMVHLESLKNTLLAYKVDEE